MNKPTVYFPLVEAGMGHIIPEKAIFKAFDEKYGDRVNAVCDNFFGKGTPQMAKFERKMSGEVVKHNKRPSYGFFSNLIMDIFGTNLSSRAAMEWYVPKVCKDSLSAMEKINPDLVFSTHWASNYYARKLKKRPLTVMYCPDVIINKLFRYRCDLMLVNNKKGYEEGLRHKIRYNPNNLKIVRFPIRSEAYAIPRDKKLNRRALGIDENKFTVSLSEGGYGIGRMREICEILAKSDINITVLAICGKNTQLYEYLKTLKTTAGVSLVPFSFTDRVLEILASSDLFCGKSGSSIAEPCFFGVPQIITKFATQIELHIGQYYINEVGSALKIFEPNKVVDKICEFVNQPQKLQPYIKNAEAYRTNYGAEDSADLIIELLKTRFPQL